MTSGWYRTLTSVVVKTTKSAEILHAAEELAHRDGFAPATHFTDTCPANSDLWATILPTSVLRLGVFHWMCGARVIASICSGIYSDTCCGLFYNFHSLEFFVKTPVCDQERESSKDDEIL